MPYIIRKNRGTDTYKVLNAITRQIHSKASTKENALRQMRLMSMLDLKKNMGNIFDK